ncbi:MAG TPA: hypothetical protein VGE63_02030 [Candidatus Paceibacterota bacterium]
MKYLIVLKNICSGSLVVTGLLFFVYLFNMVVVVNETKKINRKIEEVTSKISTQTSDYYAVQGAVDDKDGATAGFAAPLSRVYVDISDKDTSYVVTR